MVSLSELNPVVRFFIWNEYINVYYASVLLLKKSMVKKFFKYINRWILWTVINGRKDADKEYI